MNLIEKMRLAIARVTIDQIRNVVALDLSRVNARQTRPARNNDQPKVTQNQATNATPTIAVRDD